MIYNNGSGFKLYFEYLCKSYGIKCKPTTVKNPQANGLLERVHQVLGQMLHTAEIDMANSVTPDDVNVFLHNQAWANCSSHHMVLKASPGAAIFGQDILFDNLLMAGWHAIGEQRQSLTDHGNQRKNAKPIDYDYKVGDKVIVKKKVSSTRKSPTMVKSHGLLQQFIQMEFSSSYKILRFFDGTTILVSCMTTLSLR